MTKEELKDRIRLALGGTATPMAAALALDAVLRSIQEGLAEDGKVHLSNFGTFTLRQMPERCINNPRNGLTQVIAAHKHINFKAAPKQVTPLSH